MNKLSIQKRAAILGLMVEGMSIRSISRTTGASKNTIVKLLAEAGNAFLDYQNRMLRNLPCTRIQCDEIWSFVYAKAKNAPALMKAAGEAGDVWTWTAICADTKVIPCWHVGTRDADAAQAFMTDLAARLANRVQLTTDGHKAYLQAVEDVFGAGIDYGVLIKIYGAPDGRDNDRRYSPAECTGVLKQVVTGAPDLAHLSTSFVERQNLTMRMSIRRFTRLTNAFSKKLENHVYAVAIYMMHYNFVRIHKSLRVTPAMAAGVSPSLLSLEDMVKIIDEHQARKISN